MGKVIHVNFTEPYRGKIIDTEGEEVEEKESSDEDSEKEQRSEDEKDPA